MVTRYCQRCSTAQLLSWDEPHPCLKCGGAQFDSQPKLLSTREWKLTEEDIAILRVQRILPE